MTQVALDIPTCFIKGCPAFNGLDVVPGTKTNILPDGNLMVSCPVKLHQMAQQQINTVCANCAQKQNVRR